MNATAHLFVEHRNLLVLDDQGVQVDAKERQVVISTSGPQGSIPVEVDESAFSLLATTTTDLASRRRFSAVTVFFCGAAIDVSNDRSGIGSLQFGQRIATCFPAGSRSLRILSGFRLV